MVNTHEQDVGLIQMAYFLPALDHLRRRGLPVERHLRAAGLADFNLDHPETFVPAVRAKAFLERIALRELSDDPVGDLESAYRLHTTHHYGAAILSSPNLASAAKLAALPGAAVITYNSLEFGIDGPVASIADHYCSPSSRGERLIEGLSLMLLLDAMVEFGGRGCQPFTLETTLDRLPAHSVPVDLSRTRVRFRQPSNKVTFDARWLARPSTFASAHQAAPSWAPDDLISSRLTEIIRSFSPGTRPTLRLISEITGLSSRTLQRRLAEEGSSFFDLIDNWRFEQAMALVETSLPLSEIAEVVHYSEPAHFTRAFRRWTGMAPRAYREAASSR